MNRTVLRWLVPLLVAGCTDESSVDCSPLQIQTDSGTIDLCVRAAITAEERMQGLLTQPPLATGEGLLFVFPTTDELCFHTEGLGYTIDVLWIQSDGTIVDTETMPPNTAAICHGPAQYALEALPASIGDIGVGDQVTGSLISERKRE